MTLFEQADVVRKNLLDLGTTKLMALAAIAVLSVGVILAGSVYLNRPAEEVLYIGLDGTDVNQISAVLGESGMDFSVGSDGSSISVPVGQVGKARMLLAEHGLPNSATAGYELFDNVGSLGLTSFMQELTRVRALEGEIARTIQAIDGVKAARVHIVMPDRGSFRRGEQRPTASVMIRTGNVFGRDVASSVRHLVAASVPALNVDDVTVLDSAGQLLASGDDFSNSNLNRSLGLVQLVQREVETNIEKALTPFLGIDNFRASVTAELNTDSQQIQETVFDPDSRVERSVRRTQENEQSSEAGPENPATVERNIPQAEVEGDGGGALTQEVTERKEEQTNYEINSKTIATVRNSYEIEKLSVAVVINQARLAEMLGDETDQVQIDAYIEEMQQVVATAAGLSEERGDNIKLTSVDFLDEEMLVDDPSGGGFMNWASSHSGSMINALAFIIVAFLVAWFGLRPMASVITGKKAGNEDLAALEDAAGGDLELPDFSPNSEQANAAAIPGFGADFGFDPEEDMLSMEESVGGTFNKRVKEGPERRLSRMVEINEERAAKILRKWAVEGAS